jgi:hypothetical protein
VDESPRTTGRTPLGNQVVSERGRPPKTQGRRRSLNQCSENRGGAKCELWVVKVVTYH